MLLKFPPFPRFRLTGLRAWRPTNVAYPWPSCGPARRELGREAARGHPAKRVPEVALGTLGGADSPAG